MRFISCVFLSLLLVISIPAQVINGNDLTVKVALFGPGDEIYSWWGHIELIIDDERTGRNTSYDFGIFSFEDNNFFQNIALGRLLYSCGALPAENDINWYISNNRDVTVYTLDLPPEKREEIRQLAEISLLPENRYYFYHFFNNNCTTRIRDIVDIAAGGQLKDRFADEKFHFTLRQQVRCNIWFSPIMEWFLCFFLGQDIDRAITFWEAMFLPSELANCLNDLVYTGENGISRKLVSNVETIYRQQGRFPVLDVPRKQWPQGFAVGVIAAFFLVLLFFVQAKSPAIGRAALGITYSLFGLLFGGAGLLLFFMSFFTSYDYTYYNANLFFCNPLLLASFPFGIKYAAAKNYDKRLFAEVSLRFLWFLVVLGIIVSMLIKSLPMFWQRNFPCQILMLPVALTLLLEPSGLRRMIRIFGVGCKKTYR